MKNNSKDDDFLNELLGNETYSEEELKIKKAAELEADARLQEVIENLDEALARL